DGAGGGLRERDRELEVLGAGAVALEQGHVVDRDVGVEGRNHVVVFDRAQALVVGDLGVLRGARQVDDEVLVVLHVCVAHDRDRDRLRELALGEAQLAAGGGVVGGLGGGPVGGLVVDRDGAGGGLRERDRELEVLGAGAVALEQGHVVDRDVRVEGRNHVVVLDRAQALVVGDLGVLRGARQVDDEVLVVLHVCVAHDRDRDRLRELALGEAQLAAGGGVVGGLGGGPVGGLVVDRDGAGGGLRERDRELEVLGAGAVALEQGHVVDRDVRVEGRNHVVVLDRAQALVVGDLGVLRGARQVDDEVLVVLHVCVAHDRDRDRLRELALGEAQLAAGGGVVGGLGGGPVGGLVVDRDGAGCGLRERDRELEVLGAGAVALEQGHVVDRDVRVEGRNHVVVFDRAQALVVGDLGVLRGARQVDDEVLVVLHVCVAHDRDRDRLRELALGEAQLAAGGGVVGGLGGGPVGGLVVDRDGAGGGLRERDRELEVLGAGAVALEQGHVVDRDVGVEGRNHVIVLDRAQALVVGDLGVLRGARQV